MFRSREDEELGLEQAIAQVEDDMYEQRNQSWADAIVHFLVFVMCTFGVGIFAGFVAYITQQ